MAITGTYSFKGLSVPNAFVNVLTAQGGEQGWIAQVSIFADSTMSSPLEQVQVGVGYRSGADPIGDLEDKLLTLPQFAGFRRVSPKRITRLEFLMKFTQPERVAIRTAAKNSVPLEDYLAMVDIATFIDITRPDTQAGVQYLESVGLIAAGRANQILEITT